jgi:hypothetical protein
MLPTVSTVPKTTFVITPIIIHDLKSQRCLQVIPIAQPVFLDDRCFVELNLTRGTTLTVSSDSAQVTVEPGLGYIYMLTQILR